MQCISHILALVVLNTCVQDQTLLWVLQWDVNGFGASPELALGDSSTSPSTAGTHLKVPVQCKDETVLRVTCHHPTPGCLPRLLQVTLELKVLGKQRPPDACEPQSRFFVPGATVGAAALQCCSPNAHWDCSVHGLLQQRVTAPQDRLPQLQGLLMPLQSKHNGVPHTALQPEPPPAGMGASLWFHQGSSINKLPLLPGAENITSLVKVSLSAERFPCQLFALHAHEHP